MGKGTTATPLTGKAKEDYDARVAAQTESKPKRKMLTNEERIAKLEADLAAAREKATDKDRKLRTKLFDQLAALNEKREELNKKHAAVEAEFNAVDARIREARQPETGTV